MLLVLLAAFFVAIAISYYMQQRKRIRDENNAEKRKEKFNELLEQLRKNKTS